MAIVTINGKKKFFNVDSMVIEPVSNGRWNVTYDRVFGHDGEVVSEGRKFLVVGGTKSGGARNEWFVCHPLFYGNDWLPCKSMVEAVRMGAQY